MTLPTGTTPLPVLYSFRRCPYAMRARLALAISGQTVTLREVVLKDKPAELIDISPKATVPVLQLPDGKILDESLDIMRWALATCDPQHWLDADASVTKTLIAENDGPFKQALDRYKYADRHTSDHPELSPSAIAQLYRRHGERFLQQLEQLLAKQTFLFGEHARLADMAVLPFIRQFAHVDLTWFEQAPYPNVRRWLNAFKDCHLFAAIMHKYPAWQAGDADTIFTTL